MEKLAEEILEILRSDRFEGLDIVAEEELRQEVLDRFDRAIEDLKRRGDIYAPRHYFLKLTEKKE